MNSKGHLYCSIIKSLIRITGCALSVVFLILHNEEAAIFSLAGSLAVAECLGIGEELLDKR